MQTTEYPLSESLFDQACQWLKKMITTCGENAPAMSDELSADKSDRIVLFTIADTTKGKYVTRTVKTQGLGAALNQLVTAAHPLQYRLNPDNVRLDVVTHVFPIDPERVKQRKPLVSERSLVGFMLGDPTSAWLPEESVRYGLLSRKGRLNSGRIISALGSERVKNVNTENAWCFSARSRSLLDNADLFRGKPIAAHPNDETVNEVIGNAKDYLVRATKPSGDFVYAYDASQDTELDDYNILRHAGSLWALCELYRDCPDVDLHAAIARAHQYLLQQVHQHDDKAVIAEKGYVKLGGNGLSLIALADYYELFEATPELLKTMQALANWIVSTQSHEGEFKIHKLRLRDNQVMPFISDFYPGEAILGLVKLYQVDRDYRWLEAANKAANWIIDVRDADKSIDELQRDHWFLYALTALYEHLPGEKLQQQSERIATKIMRCQNRNQPIIDWNGGWKTPPLSTTTACMCEGLLAAYQLGVSSDASYDYLEALQNSIEWGLQNQLGYQFGSANSAFLPNPGFARGGFICEYDHWLLRVDFTQHSVMSFLNYQRLMNGLPF